MSFIQILAKTVMGTTSDFSIYYILTLLHMARKAKDGLSIMRLQVLSSFQFHSELGGGPHLCSELDGYGFFLEFTSTGNFLVKQK
jgi:hypothetical protein